MRRKVWYESLVSRVWGDSHLSQQTLQYLQQMCRTIRSSLPLDQQLCRNQESRKLLLIRPRHFHLHHHGPPPKSKNLGQEYQHRSKFFLVLTSHHPQHSAQSCTWYPIKLPNLRNELKHIEYILADRWIRVWSNDCILRFPCYSWHLLSYTSSVSLLPIYILEI